MKKTYQKPKAEMVAFCPDDVLAGNEIEGSNMGTGGGPVLPNMIDGVGSATPLDGIQLDG